MSERNNARAHTTTPSDFYKARHVSMTYDKNEEGQRGTAPHLAGARTVLWSSDPSPEVHIQGRQELEVVLARAVCLHMGRRKMAFNAGDCIHISSFHEWCPSMRGLKRHTSSASKRVWPNYRGGYVGGETGKRGCQLFLRSASNG